MKVRRIMAGRDESDRAPGEGVNGPNNGGDLLEEGELRAKVGQLAEGHEELQARLDKLEMADGGREELAEALGTARKRIKEVQKHLGACSGKIKEREEAEARLRQEMGDGERALRAEMKTLTRQNLALAGDLKALREQVGVQLRSYVEVLEGCEKFQKVIDRLDKENKSLRAEVKEVKTDNQVLKRDSKLMQHKLTELKDNHEILKRATANAVSESHNKMLDVEMKIQDIRISKK